MMPGHQAGQGQNIADSHCRKNAEALSTNNQMYSREKFFPVHAVRESWYRKSINDSEDFVSEV